MDRQAMRMKTIMVRAFGGPEELVMVDAPRPEPGPDEVLVAVKAAGVNPVDWKTRRGQGIAGWLGAPPISVGWDIAGVVESAGPGAGFRPGDAVYGMPLFPKQAKAYAEYVVAPSHHLVLKPASIDFVAAASVPLAALTAWQALVVTAGIHAGHKVLVHAASGGVGHFAVQIACALGARVTGTVSSRNMDFVRSLGAEPFDRGAGRFEEALGGFDVVLDTVGGETALRSYQVLRRGGMLVSIMGGGDRALAESLGVGSEGILVKPDANHLAALSRLIEAGKLKPWVDAVRPLSEAADLHALGERGGHRGKLVLSVS